MIHQVHKDFKKGHQEPGKDSPCSSSPFMESWKKKVVPVKAGDGVRGPGEPLGSFTKIFVQIGQQVPC